MLLDFSNVKYGNFQNKQKIIIYACKNKTLLDFINLSEICLIFEMLYSLSKFETRDDLKKPST